MADEAVAIEAIGNPTRRAVLELLRGGEATVRELTDALPVTQSAVSQHLKVLKDAGLVRSRPEGTRQLYSVDLGGLGEVRAWVDRFWDDVLAAFVEHAESTSTAPNGARSTTSDGAPSRAPSTSTPRKAMP